MGRQNYDLGDTCALSDCRSAPVARGMCMPHYQRMRHWGDPTFVPSNPALVFRSLGSRTCTVEGCDRPHYAQGYCKSLHYKRWLKHGDPMTVLPGGRKPKPVDDRPRWLQRYADSKFPSKDEPLLFRLFRYTLLGDDCWEWTGYKTPTGYGRFNWNGGARPAHRIWYEVLRGPIPEGMHLDHLCRNKGCVKPGHMEPVTPEENAARSVQHCVGCNCFIQRKE